MLKQQCHMKFYRIPQGGAWDEAMHQYSDSIEREFQEFQLLLTAFGFESTCFELGDKDIAIYPTENDKKVCRHLMKKKRDGTYVLRRRKPLCQEWKHRKKSRGIVRHQPPRPENFFVPACGLTCELGSVSGITYMMVKAFAPIETNHFVEIAGSDYYAAFHSLHLANERIHIPPVEVVSA